MRLHRWRRVQRRLALPVLDAFGNLEAIYTLSVFVPFLGAFPGVLHAVSVYLCEDRLEEPARSAFYYSESTTDVRHHLFATRGDFIHFMEPLAGPSNFAYWTAGAALYVMPWVAREELPNTTYAIGLLLAMLGAASYAFHRDGSRTGTWQHATDRYCMFTLLAFLACTAPNGLYHAWRGVAAGPRSAPTLASNLCAMLAVAAALSYQEEIDTTLFLGAAGTVAVACNALTMGVLAGRRADELPLTQSGWAALHKGGDAPETGTARRRRRRRRWHPRVLFCAQVASSAALQCLPFFLGLLVCNRASDAAMRRALHGDDGGEPPRALSDAERRLARRLHDVLHGIWHVLSSVFCMQASLITVEGLTGRLDAPQGDTREEWAASLLIVIVSVVFPLLVIRSAPFWLVLYALVAVELVVLAFGVLALRSVVRKHGARRRRVANTGDGDGGATHARAQRDPVRADAAAAAGLAQPLEA